MISEKVLPIIDKLNAFWMSLNEKYALIFDSDSKVSDIYRSTEDSWEPADREKNHGDDKKGYIVLFPGQVALRQVKIEDGQSSQAMKAITLEAESSMVHPPESIYTTRTVFQYDQTAIGLAGIIPKALPEIYRTEAEKIGFTITGVVVPELCFSNPAPHIFIYADNTRICIYYILKKQPMLWQVFSPGTLAIQTVLELFKQQIDEYRSPEPQQLIIWSQPDVFRQVSETVQSLFRVTITHIQNWQDVLPLFSFKKRLFRDFVEAEEMKAPTRKELVRTSVAFGIGIISCIMFFMANVNQVEREVVQLEKDVFQLKRAANRSSMISRKIQHLTKKILTIREYTEEKPMMLAALKTITDATPNLVRIENLVVSKQGAVILSGESKAEIHVLNFLNTLAQTGEFSMPRLSAIEIDTDTKAVRFAIETEIPQFKRFFKDKDKN